MNTSEFNSCPHIGLQEDRASVYMSPTPAHQCHIKAKPFVPDDEHQQEFCLCSNYTNCPLYSPDVKPSGYREDAAPKRTMAGRLQRLPRVAVAISSFALVLVTGAIIFMLASTRLESSSEPPADSQNTSVAVLPQPSAETAIPTETPTPTSPSSPSEDAEVLTIAELKQATSSAPGVGDTVMELEADGALWWGSEERRLNYRNDSFLYAGYADEQNYMSAAYFDLSDIVRGTAIKDARLTLTGLRDDRFNPAVNGVWKIELVAESSERQEGEGPVSMLQASYSEASSMDGSPSISPELQPADLGSGATNTWVFDERVRNWITQQIVDENPMIFVRITATTEGDTLFAWDSGLGSETQGNPPMLSLTLGPPPTNPPPTPTPVYVVATSVPTARSPAEAATQTAVAQITQESGGAAPAPYTQFFTPTPIHESMEAAQAAASLQGLPPIVVHTPTPRDNFEATAQSAYATAVAYTTGTYTPVPEEYVTPVWITPSATPANEATVLAREAIPVEDPNLPYNAIALQYILATPLPENAATAVANSIILTAQAERLGPATPLPPNWRVITETPTPLPPTDTPVPLFIPDSDFTPTPTAIPTEQIPDDVPPDLKGWIVFLSDRTGRTETFAIHPDTKELLNITQPWVHDVAWENYIAYSPDRSHKAIVEPDEAFNQTLQIKVYSFEYQSKVLVTHFNTASYDPAWSPLGDRIAFVSSESGNEELYTVNPAGEDTTRLTFTEGVWEKHPSWSPDGTQLVFHSNRTGKNQLWIMDMQTGEVRNLSENEYNDSEPIWIR